jgi:hypothetical protein
MILAQLHCNIGMDGTGMGGDPRDASHTSVDTVPSSPSPCTPSCLLALVKDCPTTGQCVQQRDPTNSLVIHMCFADHVRADTTVLSTSTARSIVRHNGTLCYTADVTLSDTGDLTASLQGPHGAPPVTLRSPSDTVVYVECGGKSYTIDATDPKCKIPLVSDNPFCDPGTCS